MMRLSIAPPLLVISFLALTSPFFSQTPSPIKTMQAENIQVLQIATGLNIGSHESQCDAKGNVFLAAWEENQRPPDPPFLKFDSTGSLKITFPSSRERLGLSPLEDQMEPSALLPDGGVARLVWSRDTLSVARFSAVGILQSRTTLDPPAILPYQFIVFPSGEFLVSGLERVHSSKFLGATRSFTAIYDAHGHLINRLRFPEDAEIDAAAEAGDARYNFVVIGGNLGVSSGKATLGSDGNTYLMRRTSPATVFVISADGELLRTLKIEPENFGQMPRSMQVSDGKIAVEFSLHCAGNICNGSSFTVADANTGQKLADYANRSVYGDFACYSAKPERFTFLSTDDNDQLQIVQASAK